MKGRARGRWRVECTPRIPEELVHFANQDSYTLLIKGASGTGKTALALGILKCLDRREEVLYICTRTSPSTIVGDHPWLGQLFDVSPKPKRVSEEGELEDIGVFVDGRLDEPTALFERITEALMDASRPTIVIDSWDSVGDMMDREAYYSNTKVLQSWRHRARAKLILITENPENTTFDYLADGVVVLRRGVWKGRVLREIQLSKLLGTEIERPTYYFTLKNSMFTCFGGQATRVLESPAASGCERGSPRATSGVLEEGRLQTGFADLDAAVGGGLARRSIVLLEADPGVDAKVISLFLGQVAISAISFRIPVVFGLLGIVDPAYSRQLLEASLPSSSMELASIWPERGAGSSTGYPSVQRGSGNSSTKPFEELLQFHGLASEKEPVVMISGDLGGHQSHEEEVSRTVKAVSSKASAVLVATHLIESGVPPFPVDVRIRLLERKGTLFFRSDIPWTRLYGVSLYRRSGVPFLGLEPIV